MGLALLKLYSLQAWLWGTRKLSWWLWGASIHWALVTQPIRDDRDIGRLGGTVQTRMT